MIDDDPDAVKQQLRDLRLLVAEAQAVIDYFNNPYSRAVAGTEESARWILRYDAVRARLEAEAVAS